MPKSAIYGVTLSIGGGNHLPSRTSCFGTYIRKSSESPFPAGAGSRFDVGIPSGADEASQMLNEPSAFFFSGDWLLRL